MNVQFDEIDKIMCHPISGMMIAHRYSYKTGGNDSLDINELIIGEHVHISKLKRVGDRKFTYKEFWGYKK